MFGGTKGPGKTDTILREGLRQTHKSNYRACLFRRTFPRLGEVIDRSFKYFKGMGATYSDKDIQLKLPTWTFPSGAKYSFAHLQYERDKYNHQGREWHYEAFDQLEEFTETQYLFVMAQNRTSDPDINCYMRSTANPGGIGHLWVKKRFIDVLKSDEIRYFKRVFDEDIECDKNDPQGLSRSFVFSSVYDNPSIIENDPNYIRRLEQLPEQDKQALLHGNWDIFVGQFFRQWHRNRIVKNIPIVKEWRRFCSLDYGYKKPSSVGWWGVNYDGDIIRYRELYKELLTYEQLALEFVRLTGDEEVDYIVADPQIWGDRSHHKGQIGESGYETIVRVLKEKMGDRAPIIIKADNNRINGWIRLREYMENEKIFCWDTCRDSVRTIPALIHDEKRVEDVDTTGEDHAGDDWRYGVMSRISPTERNIRHTDTARGKQTLIEGDTKLAEIFEE